MVSQPGDYSSSTWALEDCLPNRKTLSCSQPVADWPWPPFPAVFTVPPTYSSIRCVFTAFLLPWKTRPNEHPHLSVPAQNRPGPRQCPPRLQASSLGGSTCDQQSPLSGCPPCRLSCSFPQTLHQVLRWDHSTACLPVSGQRGFSVGLQIDTVTARVN